MSLRTALFAAIVLGFGGLVIVAWIGLQLPAKPQVAAVAAPVPAPTAKILVAAHPLHAGNLLKYDDIQPHDMLASEVPAGARGDTPQDRAELVGSMVRRSLQPQEVLLPADVLRPGDHGFLAAVLRPGMRATTVGVDAVSGTAGLIWPGDHVDVLLTQVNDDQTLPAAHRASAETVLGDVRVIAIDQQLMQGATGSGPEQGTTHTVTLEVTEAQAERVALAGRLGHLSLIVRAADALPDRQEDKPETTWGGDVSPALNQGRTAGRVMRVYQGTTDGKEFRF
ncbi:MAG: Flp pilus assembly protein CpaB [Acetobacteraceae bacterium]|jgi:pilus assembly protein CpaB